MAEHSIVYNYLSDVASAIKERLKLESSIKGTDFTNLIYSISSVPRLSIISTYPRKVSSIYTPASGYVGINNFTLSNYHLVQNQTFNITNSSYTVTPSQFDPWQQSGYYQGFSSFTVNALDLSSLGIIPGNIKYGIDILGVSGAYRGSGVYSQTYDVYPHIDTSDVIFYPSGGYSAFGNVYCYAVTSSIDSHIKSENIKSGVEILGVTGTYTISSYLSTLNATLSSYMTFFTGEYSDANIFLELQSITLTPSSQTQRIEVSAQAGFIAYSKVTVLGVNSTTEPNFIPSNIKQGIRLYGVTGTYDGGAVDSLPAYISNSFPSVIEENVSYVRPYACYHCNDIQKISLPECTFIDEGAFGWCTNLSEAIIPKCTTLYGFTSNCPSLRVIDLTQVSQVTTVDGTRWLSNYNLIIKVPASLYSDFMTTSPWNIYPSKLVSV